MLTIAVLHYNNDKLTDDCLKSIFSQINPNEHEVLVIDNGSEKPYGTPSNKIIRLPKNLGNIGGQNACFEHAAGDTVLFVSNDVVLHDNCIVQLLAFAQIYSNFGQIQPAIYQTDGKVDNFGLKYVWPGYGISIKNNNDICPDVIPSICYLMKKSVWREIGGFDSTLPMTYEDVDMGLRLSKLSYKRYVCHYAKVTHIGNATLRYSIKDKFRFITARKKVIDKNFTGCNRAVRLTAVNIIDSINGAIKWISLFIQAKFYFVNF